MYIFKCKCDSCDSFTEFKNVTDVYCHDYHDRLKERGWDVMITETYGHVLRCRKCKCKITTAIVAAACMGEHGLTGNSGILPGGNHINAPYDSNGELFIRIIEPTEEGVEYRWDRMTLEEVRKNNNYKNIIKCHYCDKPAVRLDHSWPYLVGMTSCADHLDEEAID